MKKKLTLALETGVYGGSLCLLEGGREVSVWKTADEHAGAGEFLESIEKALHKSKTRIQEVSDIVISVGPGSYTGLRVGWAVAKGLKASLGINVKGVSILDEMLRDARPITVAVLPFGKIEVCWKMVGGLNSDSLMTRDFPMVATVNEFVGFIEQINPGKLILPVELYKRLSNFESFSRGQSNIMHCIENLSCLLGKTDANFIREENIEIFYPKPFKIK